MAERILLVDDEPNVLEGFRRGLTREFLLDTAQGAAEALKLANQSGPYAVIVSDMRMPGMDGVQFLSAIKAHYPDTIRVMLTGNADKDTAVQAINEGNIFRFLNKPCSRELLAKTLTAALVQYRLVVAEKQLLEQTLSGSIQVLTEVLSLVNPAAFGRAERARRYIHHIAVSMKLPNVWQYEVAAMMSQLGCVMLPSETIEAVYRGEALAPADQRQYDAHPVVAHELLSKIPRLEAIARMIEHQNYPFPPSADADPATANIRQGTEILRLTLAYEQLIHKGSSRHEAVHTLSRQNKTFSPEFFHALVELDPNSEEDDIRPCQVQMLLLGMIIQQEVRARDGVLVVSKGQEVTAPLLSKLKNMNTSLLIDADLNVSGPPTTLAFVKGAT